MFTAMIIKSFFLLYECYLQHLSRGRQLHHSSQLALHTGSHGPVQTCSLSYSDTGEQQSQRSVFVFLAYVAWTRNSLPFHWFCSKQANNKHSLRPHTATQTISSHCSADWRLQSAEQVKLSLYCTPVEVRGIGIPCTQIGGALQDPAWYKWRYCQKVGYL